MYHYLSIEKIFQSLRTERLGISQEEAVLRLKEFGPNKLPQAKKLPVLKLFLRQFANPLIYILIVACVISFFASHFFDAIIVLAVVLVSSVVGFVQEYKANQALVHLKKLVKYKARVLRNGQEHIISQEYIVPGDIISLSPGDKIPADARLIEAYNFEVIEASLTGESVPSSKISEQLAKDTPLADRENMVYLGTVVAKGKAVAVVTSTGQKTELGQVATMVKETNDNITPLQKQINSFGKILGLILIAINILIFVIGVLTGRPPFEMFLTSVAMVVAAVPEGLLPAMTIILAVGMQKLAKHKGLVRKMLAAETLGSVSVICSDKTGTLTRGEMRVSQIITETEKISHDGEKFSQTINPYSKDSHSVALKIGFLCNNAIAENPRDELKDWKVVGDPTEKALLLAGVTGGLVKAKLEKEETRIAEIPFDSSYKMMATLHRHKDLKEYESISYVKGAPEKILDFCSFVDVEGEKNFLTQDRKQQIQNQYESLTGSGLRVLAVGYKVNNSVLLPNDFTWEILADFVFVGLIAIKDLLRPEAKKTIQLCQEAGIRPIIVTGDHKLTAMAVARELGMIINEDVVMEGAGLDKISDSELSEKVKNIVIFARVEPRHKIRIVSALQANGEVVAMTGDGVNDAPALKKADIGVAVGSGTDVAKEVADLVLLDDNFKTIVMAVERGRNTFNNIRKVILYLITDGFTEIVLIGGAIILGFPLPILPVQILWIKLAESAAPAMALAFDEVNENVMKDRPRKKEEAVVNKPMRNLIIFYALIMDLILFGIFYAFLATGKDFELVRTMVFAGLGLSSFFYIFSVRGLKSSILKINPLSNKFLLVSIGLGVTMLLVAIYVPLFNKVLRTVPLGTIEWLILAGYSVLSVIVYEVGKKFTTAKMSK